MIRFENITKIYQQGSSVITALRSVSFAIKQGEFVSMVGKSGAGKTTLVRLLIGDEQPTEGKVFFKEKSVENMKGKEVLSLRQRVGVVHQDYKLLYSKTIKENVEYIMQVIGASDKDIKRDTPQVLDLVGLLGREDDFPAELSGGEKQRLAIARALCHRPEVIVADEPTGNLDLYNTFQIVNLLKKIHKMGTTIILSTHNKDVIENVRKRVITLEEGRIIQDNEKGKFIL